METINSVECRSESTIGNLEVVDKNFFIEDYLAKNILNNEKNLRKEIYPNSSKILSIIFSFQIENYRLFFSFISFFKLR